MPTVPKDLKHEKQVDQYLAKLKAFLMTPDHGGGDWPEISDDKLDAAQELVCDLLLLKWGQDCDESMPVKYALWSRSTQRLPWDIPLQTTRNKEAFKDENSRLLSNMRIISGAISTYSDELQRTADRLKEIALRQVCIAAAFPVFQVRYSKPKVTDGEAKETVQGIHKNDPPASIHLSAEEADAFVPPAEFNKLRTIKRWAVPSLHADPTDDFAKFRAEVAAASNKILPLYQVLERLPLRNENFRTEG